MRSILFSNSKQVTITSFLFQAILISISFFPNKSYGQCPGGPIALVLNTPAPVCSPATVSLLDLIDPSSTLPTGTVIFYYYLGDNGQTSVTDPSAVTQTGTYKLVANGPGGSGGDSKQ